MPSVHRLANYYKVGIHSSAFLQLEFNTLVTSSNFSDLDVLKIASHLLEKEIGQEKMKLKKKSENASEWLYAEGRVIFDALHSSIGIYMC